MFELHQSFSIYLDSGYFFFLVLGEKLCNIQTECMEYWIDFCEHMKETLQGAINDYGGGTL